MIKVVYNGYYGGFSLSNEAIALLNQKREKANLPHLNIIDLKRHDPFLVEVVEELGEKANGSCAKLKIEQIPKEYENFYEITEYDGAESVDFEESELHLTLKKICNTDGGVDALSDQECRIALQTLENILKK